MLGETTDEYHNLIQREVPNFDWSNLNTKKHRLDNKEFITCGDYSLIGCFSIWQDMDGKVWVIRPNEELKKYIDYLITSKRVHLDV